MTTRLSKPITREITTMSADGVHLVAKRHRKAVHIPWGNLLQTDGEADDDHPATASAATKPPQRTRELGAPDTVAADVLLQLREARQTLEDAAALITNASDLPAALAAHREPPRPS